MLLSQEECERLTDEGRQEIIVDHERCLKGYVGVVLVQMSIIYVLNYTSYVEWGGIKLSLF